MANLKDLKGRISSVKKTQKITSAMKMVAAAKLRRAQEGAEKARPYAERMNRMLNSIAASVGSTEGAPKMLTGTGGNDRARSASPSARIPLIRYAVQSDHHRP
jgi:F-type H+-transporting ATPase subunit gamma